MHSVVPDVKSVRLVIWLTQFPKVLATLAHSERILEAAIGMTTINSLLDINESACIKLNAADLIMEKNPY